MIPRPYQQWNLVCAYENLKTITPNLKPNSTKQDPQTILQQYRIKTAYNRLLQVTPHVRLAQVNYKHTDDPQARNGLT